MREPQDEEDTSLMEGSQFEDKVGPLALGEAWQRHISCLRCSGVMARASSSLVEVPVGCSDRHQETVLSCQTYPSQNPSHELGAIFCH